MESSLTCSSALSAASGAKRRNAEIVRQESVSFGSGTQSGRGNLR